MNTLLTGLALIASISSFSADMECASTSSEYKEKFNKSVSSLPLGNWITEYSGEDVRISLKVDEESDKFSYTFDSPYAEGDSLVEVCHFEKRNFLNVCGKYHEFFIGENSNLNFSFEEFETYDPTDFELVYFDEFTKE